MAKARGMTEELWLKSRDLKRLFAHLGRPTVLIQDAGMRRRFRLFGVAAVTYSWSGHPLTPVLRQALDAAERFADDHATSDELRTAYAAVRDDRSIPQFSLSACCVTHEDVRFTGPDVAEHAYVQ